jgi:hypothetical protein
MALCHSFWCLFYVFRTVGRHDQMYYVVWLVDVDWVHLEVGLKRACWLHAELVWIFQVKVSREISQFYPQEDSNLCLTQQ